MAVNENKKFNYEALISKVKLYPAVFDSKHEMHKNRAFVNELWRQIAEGLKCTDTMCREKWANLRSNYMREMRKLRIRRVEGKPLKVTWPYFHLLEFLNPNFHKKISNDFGLMSETYDDERLVIDLKPEKISQDTDMDDSYDQFSKNGSNNLAKKKSDNDEFGNMKRKTKMTKQSDLDSEFIERLVKRVRNVTENYPSNDDKDQMFLLSLLPFIKQLNPQENLEFRMEVQHILYKKLQGKFICFDKTNESV